MEPVVHTEYETCACLEGVECSIEKALDVLGGKWTF